MTMDPKRYEPDGTPVFSSEQLDLYGFPEFYGYENYLIEETRESTQHVMDYKLEQYYFKKIHRYIQKERFQWVVLQLLGDRGAVPERVIDLVFREAQRMDWEHIRKVLKKHKLRIYYNRIPYIIRKLSGVRFPKVSVQQYKVIFDTYEAFCRFYTQQKQAYRRTYFPNMRFMALKMIEYAGVTLPYHIPLARTPRKVQELEGIWNLFLICHDLNQLSQLY